MEQEPAFDAVILAGGSARRLGGADKPMVEIGGRTMLDRVIASCAAADRIIVVGPHRTTREPVHWAREEPPGAGPVAAIAAGLAACTREWVGVFAADLPFLGADALHRLRTATAGSGAPYDGAIFVDSDGRRQWLAALYRREALQTCIARQPAVRLPDLPVRRLVRDLRLLPLSGAERAVRDCDTWEDVDAARRLAERHDPIPRLVPIPRVFADTVTGPPTKRTDPMFDSWLREAARELGRPELALSEQQQAALLELARVAAHSIARPAAPLTTFLAGYALGAGGGLDGLDGVVSALSAAAEAHEHPNASS